MGRSTSIAWADSSWNPWVGCTRKSEACRHCYAEAMNRRRKWNGGAWGPGTPRKITADSTWRQPLQWNRKAGQGARGKDGHNWLVFAGDLCDIFDDEAPVEARERMWHLFRSTPYLTWLLLTKRPENFSRLLPENWGSQGYPNVWLGVTAENQIEAGRRIDILRNAPARLRFVSFEPLLEKVDIDLEGIDWAIVGGESGGKARPFDLSWARSVQEACMKSGTAFFFKQLGSKPVQDSVVFPIRSLKEHHKRDANGTSITNFPTDLRVQRWPSTCCQFGQLQRTVLQRDPTKILTRPPGLTNFRSNLRVHGHLTLASQHPTIQAKQR